MWFQKSECSVQRVFVVPSTAAQASIPYARVNHNKYMVTDRVGYVGTSNWSGDYFTDTAGVGLVVGQACSQSGVCTDNSFRQRLQSIYERNWQSPYSHNVGARNRPRSTPLFMI